jgi:hypothetical protein
MYLIYYIYTIAANLWRDTHLFRQGPDIVHGIVRGSIQLMNTVGPVLIKGEAGFALVTGLSGIRDILTIDGLGKDPGTGGLPYPSRTAEEVCMSKMVVND